MAESYSLCNYPELKEVGGKDANHSQLIAENSCLRQKVNELNMNIEKQEAKVESLSLDLSLIKGEVSSFLTSQEVRWQTHNAKHAEFVEYRNQSLNELVGVYDSWATLLGLIIAASAVFSFLFIRHDKKKEMEKVIADASEKIKDRVENSEFLLPAVANSFDSDQVKEILDELKVDIISEQEFLIEQMINERMNNDFSGFDDVTNE